MPKSKKAGGDTTEVRSEETEVQTRTTETPVPETAAPPDPDTIRSEERQRASEIMTLCRRHDLDGLAADLIGRGVTLDVARAEILDCLTSALMGPNSRVC